MGRNKYCWPFSYPFYQKRFLDRFIGITTVNSQQNGSLTTHRFVNFMNYNAGPRRANMVEHWFEKEGIEQMDCSPDL